MEESNLVKTAARNTKKSREEFAELVKGVVHRGRSAEYIKANSATIKAEIRGYMKKYDAEQKIFFKEDPSKKPSKVKRVIQKGQAVMRKFSKKKEAEKPAPKPYVRDARPISSTRVPKSPVASQLALSNPIFMQEVAVPKPRRRSSAGSGKRKSQ